MAWYYQAVHHDLWDWDHVTGPVLFDVMQDGQVIKGVAAPGKNCLMYMWHRETGEPINPMVETAVPTETDVPGEQVWPTQPIPYNARGVPMTPFCSTYPIVTDPAGDLVLQGTDVGEFYALDARTGDELFVYQHNRPIRASPLTYEVDGKQYMSVVSTNEVLTFSLP